LSINFSDEERNEFLKVFKKESDSGEIGLSVNLEKPKIENEREITIGYDLIGVELSGFSHRFHFHNFAEDLIAKFNIKINEYGLIETTDYWKEIVEFMNDEINGFEPVPWFFVKVKKVIN